MESDSLNHKTEKAGVSGGLSKRWIAIALVILCVLISWSGTIDNRTEKYVDSAIIQAATAYAGARTLNAGISMLQSGEVGGGVVVDMSIHPFEVLDPINDMVEDYATVMKYAIGSLMIQELLVEIMSTNIFKWLMTAVAALLLTSILLFNGLHAAPLLKGFLFVALLRFLFVMTILTCGLVDHTFVTEKTEQEIRKVDLAAATVSLGEEVNSNLTPAERDEINRQIVKNEAMRDKLETIITTKQEEITSAEELLEDQNEELKAMKKEMGLVQRFNPFKNDEEYSESKQSKKETASYLKELKKEVKDLEKQLKTVHASLADQHKRLTGDIGLIEATKSKIKKLKDITSLSHIRQVATDTIESMLKLIALFVFKTLLMPLTFLFLILRTFKYIWGIDPHSLLKDTGRTLQPSPKTPSGTH